MRRAVLCRHPVWPAETPVFDQAGVIAAAPGMCNYIEVECMTELQDGGSARTLAVGARRIVSIVLADAPDPTLEGGAYALACRPICGMPAIRRLLAALDRCGIHEHTIVVGRGAEEVMRHASEVAEHCFYAYTREGAGRGEALRQGMRMLMGTGFRGDVLVMPCDRLVDERAVRSLVDRFRREAAAAALAVGDSAEFPESDRLVADGHGAVIGVADLREVRTARTLAELDRLAERGEVPAVVAHEVVRVRLGGDGACQRALPALHAEIAAGRAVTARLLDNAFAPEDRLVPVGGRRVPPERAEGSHRADLAIYLYQAPALASVLEEARPADAPTDGRLTDALAALAASGARVMACPVERAAHVLCFTSPEEQREAERRLFHQETRAEEPPRTVRAAGEWLRLVEEGRSLPAALHGVYNGDSSAVARTRRTLVDMLRAFLDRFGDSPVVLARSPGRVNLMGRHIDHQGGCCNMIAIDRDVLVVAGRRRDRTVRIHNLDDGAFPDRTFAVDAVTPPPGRWDWREHVSSPAVAERLDASRGDWSHYVEAAIARLSVGFPERRLGGMDLVVSGSVPVAAGLSSSSALVVSVAEAVLELFGLECLPARLAELCGEAEWFVGTRGGSGDHAAMKLARAGHVVRLGFLPLVVTEVVPMAEDHVIVVADSGIHARKTEGARDTFNHRVACYHIAREMLKRLLPTRAGSIEHLRDVRADHLDLEYPEIVRALAALPTSLTRAQAAEELPDEMRDRVLSTHPADMADYPVRGVALFGLSESERSRGTADLLRRGSMGELGRWMNRSHDGDRVSVWEPGAADPKPFHPRCDDEAMEDLLYAALRREPGAEMQRQSGAYGCSLPAIDLMVDTALSVEGVRGAQIAGAGLGGCMMALTRVDACDRLRAALEERYYGPRGLTATVLVCAPVAGSGVIAA